MRRIALVVTTVVCVAYILSAVSSRAGDQTQKHVLESPFNAALLMVSFDASRKGAILQDGSIRQLGERSFLVGKGVRFGERGDWQAGRTIWVAIDDILQIIEFDSVEQYKEALERYDEED